MVDLDGECTPPRRFILPCKPGNVSNTSASGNVTEHHPHKLIPGIELSGVPVGIVSLDDGRKCGTDYQVIDKLRTQWQVAVRRLVHFSFSPASVAAGSYELNLLFCFPVFC